MASAAEQLASSISFANFQKATELKKRLWFTLGALILFRLLSFVPVPGIDPVAMNARYLTVAITLVQGYLAIRGLESQSIRQNIQAVVAPGLLFEIAGTVSLVGGTLF